MEACISESVLPILFSLLSSPISTFLFIDPISFSISSFMLIRLDFTPSMFSFHSDIEFWICSSILFLSPSRRESNSLDFESIKSLVSVFTSPSDFSSSTLKSFNSFSAASTRLSSSPVKPLNLSSRFVITISIDLSTSLVFLRSSLSIAFSSETIDFEKSSFVLFKSSAIFPIESSSSLAFPRSTFSSSLLKDSASLSNSFLKSSTVFPTPILNTLNSSSSSFTSSPNLAFISSTFSASSSDPNVWTVDILFEFSKVFFPSSLRFAEIVASFSWVFNNSSLKLFITSLKSSILSRAELIDLSYSLISESLESNSANFAFRGFIFSFTKSITLFPASSYRTPACLSFSIKNLFLWSRYFFSPLSLEISFFPSRLSSLSFFSPSSSSVSSLMNPSTL